MRSGHVLVVTLLVASFALAGCSRNKDPKLLNIRSNGTPDEFVVLPTKPLEIPEDLAELPTPTPGGGNRVDPTPQADAVAALGGRGERVARGGDIPSSDAGLINHAARYGVSGGIRQSLAQEDLQYRRQNDGRLLERLANVNVYYRAYKKQSLDQHAELERWRRAGARTVSAPPAEAAEDAQ